MRPSRYRVCRPRPYCGADIAKKGLPRQWRNCRYFHGFRTTGRSTRRDFQRPGLGAGQALLSREGPGPILRHGVARRIRRTAQRALLDECKRSEGRREAGARRREDPGEYGGEIGRDVALRRHTAARQKVEREEPAGGVDGAEHDGAEACHYDGAAGQAEEIQRWVRTVVTGYMVPIPPPHRNRRQATPPSDRLAGAAAIAETARIAISRPTMGMRM
jgi:hypothetical protein